MEYIQDYTKRENRLGKYQYAKIVRFLRPIIALFIVWFLIMGIVTIAEYQKVASMEYANLHAFKPVH